MLRNATNLLTKWNARKNRKPLIVWGARQVGKTYLVKDIFADEYYSNSYRLNRYIGDLLIYSTLIMSI